MAKRLLRNIFSAGRDQKLIERRRQKRLLLEPLEDRRLLALLDIRVGTFNPPDISFSSCAGSEAGCVAAPPLQYIASSHEFTVNADATTYHPDFSPPPHPPFLPGSEVDINICVDNSGNLDTTSNPACAATSTDLVVTGTIDSNGDGDFDAGEPTGILLTGTIVAFGFRAPGQTSPDYDFRFTITGGVLASDFGGIGKDVGVVFTVQQGSLPPPTFGADFSGFEVKGDLSPPADARLTLTPETDTNAVNDQHVITATVQQDDGLPAGDPFGDAVTGFGPAANGTVVVFTLTNSNGATATFVSDGVDSNSDGNPGNDCVVTGGAGMCSVTINSPTAGLVTINASTTVDASGIPLTRDTDPATLTPAGHGGGGPVTKRYVDANIKITPPLDTNKVGDNHAFVVTVQQNAGDGAGFVAAPIGHVDVTLTNFFGANAVVNPALSTCDDSGDNLDAAGQCMLVFTSATTGKVVGDATVTLNVAGVTLTRDTIPASPPPPGPGGSNDDAVKVFVNAEIEIDADSTNPVGTAHTFTVTVREDAGNGAGFVPAAGETVTVSLVAGSVGSIDSASTCVTGTTDAAGQCTVIVNSNVAGSAVVHVESDVIVGGITVPVETTPISETDPDINTDDARKTWNEQPKIAIEKYVKKVNQPECGGEGLTPGFWKQEHHFYAWTNYAPGESYEATFGVDVPGIEPDFTLLNALSIGGGGINALLRHSTAALLNAANPNIDYNYTESEIKALTKAAIESGDPVKIESLKNKFDEFNNQGADLSTPEDCTPSGSPDGGLGSDADTPQTAIGVLVGDTVQFTYVVTNPGEVPIELDPDPNDPPPDPPGIGVYDDNATPGTADDFRPAPVLSGGFNVGDNGPQNGQLDPGEEWLYSFSMVVTQAGDRCNIGYVNGVSVPGGTPVNDNDAACYTTQAPEAAIDIEKYVKAVPSSTGGGEGLTPGFWKQEQHFYAWTGYTQSQSYNAVFGVNDPAGSSLTLLGALERGGGDENALGRHAVAALLNAANPNVDYAFTTSQIIAMVQQAYAADAYEFIKDQLAAENEKGADLTPSSAVNSTTTGYGDDADFAPGPTFPSGSQVTFTFVVTNVGDVPLTDVVVTDPDVTVTPVLDGGFNIGDENQNNVLETGETWLYTATETAGANCHVNTGTVTATPVGGSGTVSDEDKAHYCSGSVPPPAADIDIEKYVKLASSGGGEGLTPGFWKQPQHFYAWTGYTQADSFNTVFGVNDPESPTLLEALKTGGGGLNALGRHAVAALLNAASPNVEYAYTVGEVIWGVQHAYANPSYVEVVKDYLAKENEKGADLSTSSSSASSGFGEDADSPPGLEALVGSQVTFTYVVTNPGQAELSVVVKDDNETPASAADDFSPTAVLVGGFNAGDDDQDGKLDPGEVWLYTHSKSVTLGQHTNIGTATGTPVGGGSSATDSDAANWLGYIPTKFYVVNDGSNGQTYEYSASGTSVENYGLSNGNIDPRGVASIAAGNKIWVVDANRKVYIYNTSGTLLSSWSATFGNSTQTSKIVPEGIATNGTDIWIVDNYANKVFKFNGAANQANGTTKNFDSSFSLNSSNGNPKGIVTDGAYIWVVNDGSPDKVFRYTVGGTHQGSWTIDSNNSQPTDLTIDPSGGKTIWIVDAGKDKVFQYNNATTKTSGSLAATTWFALASGNTNPQGIADPPFGDSSAVDPAAVDAAILELTSTTSQASDSSSSKPKTPAPVNTKPNSVSKPKAKPATTHKVQPALGQKSKPGSGQKTKIVSAPKTALPSTPKLKTGTTQRKR